MDLTTEQKELIEETVTNKPGTYGCQSCAGSGKSFTIFKAIDYIKEHEPDAKILYLVFNKANQLEAQQKLMKYAGWEVPVDVKTAHSFAHNKWTSIFGPFTAITSLQWNLIQQVTSTYYDPEIKWTKKAPFVWLHDQFCSTNMGLDTFVKSIYAMWEDDYNGLDKPKEYEIIGPRGKRQKKFGIYVNAYSVVTRAHADAFKEIYELHTKNKLFTHSMYLKHAALSTKSGGSKYDYVFFDEAQDANKMMLRLLEKQDVTKTYFIGDERQSIYKFDGSNENVFLTKHFDKLYHLSRSFRFGNNIANLAQKIIKLNSDHIVTGTEQTHAIRPNSKAYLFRTNAKLFESMLDFAYSNKLRGDRIRINLMKANEDESAYLEILAFLGLYYRHTNYKYYAEHQNIFPTELPASLTQFNKRFNEDRTLTFEDVYNEQYDGLSDDIHSIYTYAKVQKNFIEKYIALQEAINDSYATQEITAITMHRSKGLEWDDVIIAEPSKLYYADRGGTVKRNPNYMQEMNLMYVAVTRARKRLNALAFAADLENESIKDFEEQSFIIGDKENETSQTCVA